MKYLLKKIEKTLFITFFALQAMFIQAQTYTPPGGGVTLTTQAEVFDLSVALGADTIFDGNITINEASGTTDPITNLSSLSSLTSIGGYLRIEGNAALETIGNFSALTSIGGIFDIRDNVKLQSLGDFSALGSIGGVFDIRDNDALETIGNFSKLTEINSNFFIYRNDNLQSLGDFSALGSIGGVFDIRDNDTLETIGNFSKLTEINSNFLIYRNDNLQSLGDFSALGSIGGIFDIRDNVKLQSLDGFSALTSIGGYVYILNNGALETIGNFSALTSIGGYLYIENNSLLQSLDGFSALTSIGGYLRIHGNANLQSLDGFSALTSIGGYLYIENNSLLLSLDNFSTLTSIGTGSVHVPSENARVDGVSIVVERNLNLFVCCDLANFLPAQANPVGGRVFINNNSASCNLPSTGTDDEKAAAFSGVCETATFTTQTQIDAFDFATSPARDITIGPSLSNSDPITDISNLSGITPLLSLTITGNPELQNLDGLSDLKRISGDFVISDNANLQSLGNSYRLIRIGENFVIRNNANLQSLGNLSKLTRIEGNLEIRNNTTLPSLGDLSALTRIGGYLGIQENTNLQSLGNLSKLTSIGSGDDVSVPSESNPVDGVSIVVEANPKLFSCCDLADFLPAQANPVSSRISITNNSAGCNVADSGTDDEKAAAFSGVCETLTFTTQIQINAFNSATSHARNIVIGPSLSASDPITNISSLSGITSLLSLTITENQELQNVGGLSNLTAIVDNLTISNNTVLVNLNGFSALANVDGNITVKNNAGLESLGDSSALTSIGGNLEISGNANLQSLGDLSTLTSIGVYLNINSNTSLQSIDNFSALETVGQNLSISENGNLQSIDNFSSLTSIGGNLQIQSNTNLLSIGNFSSLTSIGGYLRIQSNGNLKSLGNFSALRNVVGYLQIHDNTNLLSIGNFSVLTNVVGYLGIQDNTNLLSLGDFSALTGIGGDLLLQRNGALKTISSFSALTGIGGDLLLQRNGVLETIGSFSALENIGGKLDVGRNTNLLSLGDFSALTGIEGSLLVGRNTNLLSLGDFSALETIEGDLFIKTNAELQSLGNFSALTSTGGYLLVENNANLLSLGDFSALETIGGYLQIKTNAELQSLGNFSALTSIGVVSSFSFITFTFVSVSIAVEDNPKLFACCDLADFLPANAVSGSISITNNSAGCNLADSGTDDEKAAAFSAICEKLTFTTQNQIDAFDFANAIAKNIVIGPSNGSNAITNISRLSEITTLLSLTITENQELQNVGGLSNLTHISGNLSVANNPKLRSISDFSALTSIGGVNIQNNFALETIGNFSALKSIGGGFSIIRGFNLETIGDLSALETIGGEFFILQNTALQSLGNLSALKSIGGRLVISHGTNLQSLGDLSALKSIGSGVMINNNNNLQSLGNLSKLTSIGSGDDVSVPSESNPVDGVSIVVEANPKLYACCDIADFLPAQANAVSGRIFINDNLASCNLASTGTDDEKAAAFSGVCETLTFTTQTQIDNFDFANAIAKNIVIGPSLSASGPITNLSRLSTITSLLSLTITENQELQNVGGLSNLTAIVDNLTISNNPLLVNLDGFPALTAVGSISMSDNAKLQNISGLSALTRIGGSLSISSNDSLETISGLSALTSIGGDLSIQVNDDLETIGDLSALTSIGGYVYILNNGALETIDNFSALKSIGGYLAIQYNSNLTDMGNFPALKSIGGRVSIFNNGALETMGDFSALKSIGGYLYIQNNAKLLSLGNFSALTSIGSSRVYVPSISDNVDNVSIVVEDNSSLSDCYVLTDFLPGGSHAVSGGIYINNNAVGCNSRDEIMASAPHTIMLTSHTDGDSISIAYDEVTTQTIMFSIGGGATGWTSDITGDGFIILDTDMNVAQDTGVAITVRATPTKNTRVARIAVITFTTEGGTGAAASATVTIRQAGAPPTLLISTNDTTINHDAGALAITFELGGSAMGWQSTLERDDFIDLDTEQDARATAGEVTIMAMYEANTGVERKDTIVFTTTDGVSDTVVITQEAAPLIMLSTSAAVNINYNDISAQTITFNVGGSATGWDSDTVYSPVGTGFITLTPTMNANQTGEVTVEAQPTENTGAAREVTITFYTTGQLGDSATAQVTIEQGGASNSPALDLTSHTSGDTVKILHSDGAATMTDIAFMVGGNATGWTSNIVYTPVGADFITLTNDGNVTGAVVVMATPTGINSGIERSATITLSTTGPGTPDEATLTITQAGAPPMFTLISDSVETLAYDAEAASDITFEVGGGATGWWAGVIDGDSDNNFVTLSKTSGSAGLDTIKVTTVENRGEERVDTVVVGTGGEGEATDTIIVTQEAVPTIEITDPSDGMITIDYNDISAQTITFNVGGSATGWDSDTVYSPVGTGFITLTPTMNANQTGEVTVEAQPTENTGAAREVTITFYTTGQLGDSATAQVTIEQGGASNSPALDLTSHTSGDTVKILHSDGAATMTDIAFMVGGNATGWTSNIVYTPVGADFITLTNDGNVTGAVVVMATPTGINSGIERSATITLSTTGPGTPDEATLTITQAGAPPMFTLISDSVETLAYDAEAASDITFEVGGGATGWWAGVIDGDSDNNFVTLSKTSGSAGLDTIKVTTVENRGEERVDTVVVGTGGEGEATDTIIVTQEAVPTIEITDPSDGMITIDYNDISAQTITFNVGGSATGWVASSDQGFVRLDTMGSSGTGIEVTATPMENVDVERSATITLMTTGQLGASVTAEVTIMQAAAPISPTLEITTPSNAAGDTTVAYTATPTSDSVEIAFTVGNAMGWESMISYGDGVDEFITLSETDNAAQVGEVTIKAAVTENEGVERTAVITIMTRGGTGAPATATVMITQDGVPPTLRLISKNKETLAYDETTETAIMFEVGGGATGWRSSITYIHGGDFITLDTVMNANQTGDVTVRATPTDNTGVERTALIAISTMGGTGVATTNIIITQESVPTIALSTSRDINIAYNEVSAQLLIFDIGGSATGWIVSSDQDFVTLNNEIGDLGTGIEVLATPMINNGVSPRTATITISTTGQLGAGETATVMLTQGSAPASPVLVPLSFTDGDNVSISYDETTETVIEFVVGGGATGWSISSSNEDFITINPSMGAPGQNISVTAIPEGKNTGVERMAVITLSTLGPESTSLPVTATLTIVQGGASPVLSLTSEARDTLAYDAQTASDITFTLGGGATGWSHEITYSGTSEAFLTLTGDTTMSGEVRVVVASEVNMGMERTATITIKTAGGSGDALDTMITIVQATSPPVLRLISSHREVIAHDRITVINIIFDVGGGATGWEVSVEDDNNFLTVDRTMGVPGENIAVVARSIGLNAGVERSAVVRIRAMRGVGAVVDTFVTITQMGAVPTLSVGNSGGSIAYNSTEATINFSIGGGATGWKVSSIRSQVADENFITSPEVGEIRNVRGDQRLSITLEENRGLQRLAVIRLETVGGTSNAVSADFLVLQDAAPPTLRLTSRDSAFISHDVTRLSDITFEVGGGATGWRAEVIEGSASNDNDFLILSNNRGSSGLGRIRVDVRNNLGLSRTGRISIRTVGGTGSVLDTVITIRQGSAPPALTLTSRDREDLAYDAKTASDITFTLGGGATGWSSDITYSEGAEAFLTLTGEEDKRGDVRVVVASEVNMGMERTATVTIKTAGGSGDALDTMITIVQELVPTISVTTSQNISIAYDEDLPQTITFEVGGSATGWTASSDQDFVSLSPMLGDSGSNIKVEATSTINNGSARTATITFLTTGQLGSSATAEVTLLQGAINIAVTTQAEVNGLTTILAGATKIDGNLTIGDVEDSTSSRSDITDLTPLGNITHITGNLIIASNSRLSDLRSLTGLQSIGGSLSVTNNDSLSTLGDFTRLHSIGGALSVTGNDTLEALGNFSVLTNLGTGAVWVPSQDKKVSNTSIVVSNNPFLSLCSTLEEFLVGGVRAVEGGVYIDNNSVGCNSSQDIQTSFIGHIIVVTQAEVNALRVNLLGKTIINGNLIIGDIYGFSSQNDITDLTPLRNITHITGNLIVAQNEQLVHLTGIHNLETIGGYFVINFNDQLITLGEFPSLTNVGIGSYIVPSLNERKNDVSILVENNPGLSNCCALESFLDREKNKTEGEIYIMNNSTGCDNTAEVAMCNFIPPVIISLTKDSVSENVPLGTTVGVFSITGGDDGLDVATYVYELGDDAAGLFTLFGDTLKTAKVFDFEIEKSYLITLMTHHPDEGKFYDSIFTLTIRNVNEPPTALSLTNVSVSENLPSGTVVGRLSTVDDDIKNDVGDAGDFHTYTLGGVEGGLFSIQDDNELVTSASFDFETTFSYEIDITSRDVGGLMWTQTFTILVTDSNDAPTDITLSNDSINENSDVGTAIGTFITTDQDDPENNDTYIYTLKGTFFDIFQIVDDTLKTKIPLNYEEQSSYEVQITTEDGQGGIYDTTLVISVKDVNDVPIGIDITNNLFPENASMGTLVGVLTTMDEDDTVHTYELGDDASGLFTLFGDTLKTARGFNFEDRSLYTIEITTRDADTSFTQGLTIDITDENDAPTFVIISNHVIAENAEPGVVGFLTALDEDADDQHVYFLSGAGVVPFTISGNRLFSTKRLDYEEQSSYEIFIKARDQSDAESDTIPFIINITNVNEPPTAISLTDTMVSENEPSGTVVGRLITVDDDLKNDVGDASDLHTYTLGGVDSGFFSITDSYELVTSTSFDFEATFSYEIVITSRDRAGFAWTQTFTISITDSNDSPTNISLSANVIAENQVSDTLIGVLSSTDPDVGDFHTYSLRDDSDTFQIVGNELQSKLPLNYETNSRPVITIISNDGKGGIFEKDFTLEVTNENDAPTAITLSNDTINENKERGTVIGIFNSIDEDDPNMDSVYTYSIENDTFQIVGDTLKTKLSLNYEEKLSYTIQITTDDGQGGIYSGDLIIRVYNINDAPTAITLSNHAIDENVSIGSTIGTLHTVDEDENENHHYVLSGIDDGRSFRIVGNNRLATNDLFDYEKDSSYTISITTQDHGDSLWTQSFTITINNVNEKPTNITLSKNTIEENSDEGTVIGELSTLDPDDPDNNDTYNYSIEGDTTFQIVDNELQVKMPLVYAEKRRHTLSITTQDNGDSTLTEDFIITVENTNDTLPSITLTRDSVAENQDDGAVIGVLSSENGGMNNEYSSDNSLFTISKDTLKTASMFNYEAIPIHYVTITIVDERGRTFSDDFLIKVTNENDTPTDIEINADSIEENIEGRVVIGTVRTVDEDINDEHMYTVNDAAFSFDGNKLITDTPFDYEAKNSYPIFITSNTIDGINEEIKTFTIYVTDVNDAPSAIQLTHTSVAENDSIGTLVGTLSTMDDDLLGGNPRGDTHLYRLVNDNDSESKFFRISGDRLEIDTTFNYEIQSSYDLVLVTTDRDGASLQQSFTITIEDVNDVPTSLSLSNDVVKEKEEAYTVIGILSTEDEDDLNMDSVYTYSVNNDTFRIDNDTLKTNRELDFETQSEYLVAITTVDGRGGTRIEDFPLKVSNVNEPPTAIQLTDTSVAENNPADTLIGILSTTDEDLLNNNKSNDTHSYTLVEDTDKNIFRIQADTLKTKVRFNYEQRESYPISILVTDKEGSTHIERFTIAIQDRNDAPMDISLSKNTVTENEAIGTVIGILSTDDEDDPSMDSLYTYSVNNDTFNIDE